MILYNPRVHINTRKLRNVDILRCSTQLRVQQQKNKIPWCQHRPLTLKCLMLPWSRNISVDIYVATHLWSVLDWTVVKGLDTSLGDQLMCNTDGVVSSSSTRYRPETGQAKQSQLYCCKVNSTSSRAFLFHLGASYNMDQTRLLKPPDSHEYGNPRFHPVKNKDVV